MSLEQTINDAFARASEINAATTGDIRDAVNEALALLDAGKARVAEKIAGESGPQSWKVNQWLKKAVSLMKPHQQTTTVVVTLQATIQFLSAWFVVACQT